MYRTKQEKRWAGELGNKYTKHNTIYATEENKNTLARGQEHVRQNVILFDKIFKGFPFKKVKSVLEFGAGVGMNLIVLKDVFPKARLSAVEINQQAADKLKNVTDSKNIFVQSMFDPLPITADLVLSKGLLIHINPRFLKKAYSQLYNHSNRYIILVEHYSRKPKRIEYRGYKDAFWKRHFAGEMLAQYPDLKVLRSGPVKASFGPGANASFRWYLMQKGKV